jgi:hypothetical protein
MNEYSIYTRIVWGILYDMRQVEINGLNVGVSGSDQVKSDS